MGGQSNHEQATMSVLAVERERRNESKYRAMYTDLLKKHRGVIGGVQGKPDHSSEDYTAETTLLRNAMTSERGAMLQGCIAGMMAFVSVRYLPATLIKRFGGAAKVKALREAEEQARTSNVGAIRNATALLVESMFAVWVGTRGYQIASSYTEGTYEMIAQIPLCEGRSVVSDVLCDEWIDLSRNKVPREFWQNIDHSEKGLQDIRTWRAIQSFTKNCGERRAYESIIRKERGIANEKEPVVLPTSVPIDVSEEEAKLLVTDQ